MSTRQTAHVLNEVHGIKISYRTIANYALTTFAIIKPFVNIYNYKTYYLCINLKLLDKL